MWRCFFWGGGHVGCEHSVGPAPGISVAVVIYCTIIVAGDMAPNAALLAVVCSEGGQELGCLQVLRRSWESVTEWALLTTIQYGLIAGL
jgi:hypothetical protein